MESCAAVLPVNAGTVELATAVAVCTDRERQTRQGPAIHMVRLFRENRPDAGWGPDTAIRRDQLRYPLSWRQLAGSPAHGPESHVPKRPRLGRACYHRTHVSQSAGPIAQTADTRCQEPDRGRIGERRRG